jgi:hypothetical protein
VPYTGRTLASAAKASFFFIAAAVVLVFLVTATSRFVKQIPTTPSDASVADAHGAGSEYGCPGDEYVRLYGGDGGSFCQVYGSLMASAASGVRRKIAETKDRDLRSDVVEGIRWRAAALRREERSANMTVSDSEVAGSLTSLLGEDLGPSVFEGEIAEMSSKFKVMLYDLADNGTSAEKGEFRVLLRYYLASRDKDVRKGLAFDADAARKLMAGKRNITLCGSQDYRIC